MMIYLEIELYKENGQNYVYLAHNGSSGCKYPFNSLQQVNSICANYIEDVIGDTPKITNYDDKYNQTIDKMLAEGTITLEEIRIYQHAYANGHIDEDDIEEDGYNDVEAEAILKYKL